MKNQISFLKFVSLFVVAIILIGADMVAAQTILKKNFRLPASPQTATGGILGNGISDLLLQNNDIWVATGFGLNLSGNGGQTWKSFNSKDYIGNGGPAAMAFMDDSTLWVSTAFDSTVKGDDLLTGGGLSYTRNNGLTWVHLPQPIDSRDETRYSPTTTPISNITFDIAFVDSTIWIASFGGGLRRSDDMGQSWQVVTTDGKPFSSFDYENHRAFSLLVEHGNLWVGTAEGISKSTDNGQTWKRFVHDDNDSLTISGNFIVALAYQPETHTVWAATVEALGSGERRGISKSSDAGQTWDVVMTGVFAHNFGFDGEMVFAATDLGMFISDNAGTDWYTVPHIIDELTGEEVLNDEFFSAASQKTPDGTKWWLGGSDGLVSTSDHGYSWHITRSFVSTVVRKSPAVYAYPSPFSPPRGGYTRFQYDVDHDSNVEIKVFNFAMEPVITIHAYEANVSGQTDRSTQWDGRDASGRTVASGVYFFRAKIDGQVSWGKVVIIN